MKGTGAEILLTINPKGRFREGTIVGTPKPGTVMQIKADTAPVGGRFSYVPYNTGGDGRPPVGSIWVLLPDQLQGFSALTAYVTGTRGFLYSPIPGDELNMLLEGQAGTGSANEFDIGDRLMVDDVSGLLVLQTDATKPAPFICNEEITETANVDTLAWCTFSGSV